VAGVGPVLIRSTIRQPESRGDDVRGAWKKFAIAGASLVAVALVLGGLAAMPSTRFAILRTVLPLTTTLTVAPLRGNAYWISGGISNTGFVVGDTGVVVIDTQMFVSTARKQLEDIARITTKPVNVVILTHSDPDHVNGLPAYPHGIEIIAQENARADIVRAVRDPLSNGFPAVPGLAGYVPTQTVQSTVSKVIDGVNVVLMHVAAAHTDGDLIVYLPAQKIVFAGDVITTNTGRFPVIHLDGSSLGWIESMKAILALDADLYVPGHGDMLTKAELESRLAASVERRAQVKVLFDEGKTLEQAKAALKDVPLKGTAAQFPTFVATTYEELAVDKASGSSMSK